MTKNSYQGYFIDLDGTMYRGKERIPAAARFILRLQSAGKQVLFVTNNSTRSPHDVATNLQNNHDINVNSYNVYTSALATADYLDQLADASHRSVYIVGEDGLKSALAKKGFRETTDHPDYVVVGLDSHVKYDQLATAVLLIRSGAKFVGTNPDSNLPNERGMVPGAGSFVKLVEYATQTKPIMIGKPSPIIMEMALKKSGLQKKDVVMVGDNYHTDIEAAINFGIDSLLVYTGLSTKKDIAAEQIKPTHEVDSLDEWQVN
ncbi:HAD family haloacid dehalogenase hydrolase [Limosilactobacillus frumenti DSM 13145]|uniref:Acid sugar phosphatase n=1 Tax=Limosilactobacillus frumenti DSM 13145 TaxID=1423746 RepID=A0A0R1P7W3_9LACO|nr:TIGR01457 family HAD-type hydrolase [Limosilactobacillus frumenti]KRL28558.1 HAD family haloacid dehalogenase hydrolase [Limosilactobacillus frumenti DSM 13145]MBA2914532.1 TIGR01457 family HAD-type hydrolase [Limosilactobacillus frumenti]QFG72373.1 TIGR01457 family HAD-type hydrolase [Limosilactobacillus frumenti]